jgi:hypothetical protein
VVAALGPHRPSGRSRSACRRRVASDPDRHRRAAGRTAAVHAARRDRRPGRSGPRSGRLGRP